MDSRNHEKRPEGSPGAKQVGGRIVNAKVSGDDPKGVLASFSRPWDPKEVAAEG